jgi:sulfatase modifying factor 1
VLAALCSPTVILHAAEPGMVWIPGGMFTMGSDQPGSRKNEQPAHRVSIDAFWMDAHDVTNAWAT